MSDRNNDSNIVPVPRGLLDQRRPTNQVIVLDDWLADTAEITQPIDIEEIQPQ